MELKNTPHSNSRIGVCARCNNESREKALLQDIYTDALFDVMNSSPNGPFNRRALFCKNCIEWAKKEAQLIRSNKGQPIKLMPPRVTPEFDSLDEDPDWYSPSTPVSQLSDSYQIQQHDDQVTLSSPTGLSALNMRPVGLMITTTNNRNSPMEADMPTDPLYSDISETDDARAETHMLVDSMSDANQFISTVLNSDDDNAQSDPLHQGVFAHDNQQPGPAQPRALANNCQSDCGRNYQMRNHKPLGYLDPLELISNLSRIEPIIETTLSHNDPILAVEPPNEFADLPNIQSAQLPTNEQRGVQRIELIDSEDDLLDDSVPGQYFDC